MTTRTRNAYTSFDPQFWVLFVGILINAASFSLIFSFLTQLASGWRPGRSTRSATSSA